MGTRYQYLKADVERRKRILDDYVARAERGDSFTEAELKAMQTEMAEATVACTHLAREKTDRAIRQAIADLGNGVGPAIDDGPGAAPTKHLPPRVKALGGSGWGTKIVTRQADAYGRFKALTPTGSVPVTVPVDPEPVRLSEPVLALRQLIPTVQDTTGEWKFWRQTVRQNNAAVVAPGARKPTSPFEGELRTDRARVIAHLSDPVVRQVLDDAPMLREFLDTELRLGVEVALEDEIVNGDGTGEHFEGLTAVSGHQVQSWSGDLFKTTRQAVTKLEALGLTGSGWVFAPADWERIELAGNDYGYALAQAGQPVPVDRAARRLWGIPVSISTAVPVGSGFLADFAGSTELRIREEARIDWSEHLYSPDQFGTGQGGTLFAANEVVFRCEMRAGFSVKRPAGIVALDLTA